MEAEKLTIATTPDEVHSLFEIRRQGMDWDGSGMVIQEVARRVYRTFRDEDSVRLVHPESGRGISWNDLLRASNVTGTIEADRDAPQRQVSPCFATIDPVCALVYPEAHSQDGVPWGTSWNGLGRGYIQVLTLANATQMLLIGPDTPWESFIDTVRSWSHPFSDMVITDQYIMSKGDDYLATLLPAVADSLRARDQTSIPRITLIESTKRLRETPDRPLPNAISQETAENDLSRLVRIYPGADWSVVCADLRHWGRSNETRKTQRKDVADFLHGRFVTTNALQIQFDPGLDLLTSRRTRESRQPILKNGRVNAAAALEESGRAAILRYVARLKSMFAEGFASKDTIGIAGNVSANRLLSPQLPVQQNRHQ